MPDNELVVVVGGGICGVLAAQRLARENIDFIIVERGNGFGGNWLVRANSYSHLQAYAALYQWHRSYLLHAKPFTKVPGSTVLETIRQFAKDHKLAARTLFKTEVTNVKRNSDKSFTVDMTDLTTAKSRTVIASSIFVASGILGQQVSPAERGLLSLKDFTGLVTYAGRHQGTECILGDAKQAAGKDVVILGTGAFALEAMEAAHRAKARSITLLTRRRDRWILPYSRQFKFVFLATNPFLPRALICWMINSWMTGLYRKCGIAFMGPEPGSDFNFTGQCNDAFFQYAYRGEVRYMVDKIQSIMGTALTLASGISIPADIIVQAQGCEVMWQPPYLKELGLDFKKDLHNFAFLGKTARIGTASDWVWYNVPHGPQKQIESFICGQKCIRVGKEEAFEAALALTPFSGCKGESLVSSRPSGLQARARAFKRSMTAGKSLPGRVATSVKVELQEIGTWLLCALMYFIESVNLAGWLDEPHDVLTYQTFGKTI